MHVSTAYSLCLQRDLTYQWRSTIRAAAYDTLTREETSAAYGDDSDRGTWWVEPADPAGRWNLHLRSADGTEHVWLVRFYKGNLVRGDDDLWAREES